MASDSEDDYLSFSLDSLESAAVPSTKPLTYAERRKQAQKQSEIKNVANRKKSRREREAEAREEGLRQSLFERAKAEEEELGAKNKAMNMMLRMGFKPGEALGRNEGGASGNAEAGPSTPAPAPSIADSVPLAETPSTAPELHTGKEGSEPQHRTVPLSVDVWSGKKGVGLGKRTLSPSTIERVSKVAKVDEEAKHETYRSRAREAFEERRATGQLMKASRTLLSLDEKAGVQFNVLWLDPQDPATFPAELLEALSLSPGANDVVVVSSGVQEIENERLRKQMQLDALQPLEELAAEDDDEGAEKSKSPKKNTPLPLSLSEETIGEARDFLRLGARDRLTRVLHYLREKYNYCFWCGTQYNDKADLDGNCPGEDEEAHD